MEEKVLNCFTLCGILYLVEAAFISIWYRKVIKIEMAEKHFLKRIFRTLRRNFFIYIKIELGSIILNENEEAAKLNQYIKNMEQEIGLLFPYFVSIVALTPIIISLFWIELIKELGQLTSSIFCIIILILMLWDYFKTYSQKLLSILYSVKRLVNFMERNELFLIDNITERRKIKIYKINCVWMIIIFLCVVGELLVISYFQAINPEILAIPCTIYIAYIFLNDYLKKIKKKREYHTKEKKIEIRCFELLKYESIINSMCQKLKIKDVNIDIIHETTANAYSKNNDADTPTILISTEMMNRLREIWLKDNDFDIDGVIGLILGHELVHVKYKDSIMIGRRARIASSILLGGYILALVILYTAIIHTWFLSFLFPILLIELFCSNIVTDRRFWGQISELRADKIGALISGTSFKTFESFWELMGKQRHEEDATEKINQQNLLYKYYKRYIEIEYHPTIKRRKEVVAKTRKWGLADYLEQIIVIWKSKLRKKGWNGR